LLQHDRRVGLSHLRYFLNVFVYFRGQVGEALGTLDCLSIYLMSF
jgi:hypothetical protein